MGQRTIGGADLTARRERYRTLVNERLPAAAGQAGDWPIHQDHCFARVVLDNVFQGVWYDHVDGRPAYTAGYKRVSTVGTPKCRISSRSYSRQYYEHLSGNDLDAAIDIAERLLRSGAPLVTKLNERSLRWRDEP